MKNVKFNLLSLLSILFISAMVFVACNPDDDMDDDPEVEKLFSPSNFTATNGPTSVTFQWNASQFAPAGTEYAIEISKSNDFADVEHNITTSELTASVNDSQIDIKVDYFARIKAVASSAENEDSDYTVIANAFRITGEQLFLALQDSDITDVSVRLRWAEAEGITTITISENETVVQTVTLSTDEITAREALVEGLTAETEYVAELFAGEVSKGTVSFTTKEESIYDLIITPTTEGFRSLIENAEDGSLIGFEPGEYDIMNAEGTEFSSLNIVAKNLTIESTSGDPSNTTINFREFNLVGDGAGVVFRGITFDGAKSTANGQNAEYFMNLRGEASDGAAASFDMFVLENCVVKNMNNCYFRGNRGSGANDHKIELIRVNNSIIGQSALVAANYGLFIFNKLEFTKFELTNSTFYQAGRSFIDLSVTMSMPVRPEVIVDHCTINGWGTNNSNKWILVDANATDLEMNITNSIFANAPYPETGITRLDLFRTNGGNSILNVTNCNLHNLTSGISEPLNPDITNNTPLVIPATVNATAVTTETLPWTFNATDFSLPAGSPLRTASTTGGPIGDPRWAN